MAQRQVRGIAPGLLDQAAPGFLSLNYLQDFPPQGKVTASGLVVVPFAGDPTGPPGDPIVTGVARKVSTEPVQVVATQTRDAANQAPTGFPWLLVAAAAAAAFL